MEVAVSIAEMHRFEMHDALLIYLENLRSFITWHTVTAQQQGPPLHGPAQPLTKSFVEDLAESLPRGCSNPMPIHRSMMMQGISGKHSQIRSKKAKTRLDSSASRVTAA